MPSSPSHARSCWALDECTVTGLAAAMVSSSADTLIGRKLSSQGESRVKSTVDDHDLIRHPRVAGGQALDDTRARATGRSQPAALVASGAEQAVRGTQEARRPWLRQSE